jgi:hypothetical protein
MPHHHQQQHSPKALRILHQGLQHQLLQLHQLLPILQPHTQEVQLAAGG